MGALMLEEVLALCETPLVWSHAPPSTLQRTLMQRACAATMVRPCSTGCSLEEALGSGAPCTGTHTHVSRGSRIKHHAEAFIR